MAGSAGAVDLTNADLGGVRKFIDVVDKLVAAILQQPIVQMMNALKAGDLGDIQMWQDVLYAKANDEDSRALQIPKDVLLKGVLSFLFLDATRLMNTRLADGEDVLKQFKSKLLEHQQRATDTLRDIITTTKVTMNVNAVLHVRDFMAKVQEFYLSQTPKDMEQQSKATRNYNKLLATIMDIMEGIVRREAQPSQRRFPEQTVPPGQETGGIQCGGVLEDPERRPPGVE
jgi:hypothetical protein